MSELQLHAISLERMVRAVEKVRERLRRATAALSVAKIPYAVAGGNAVAAWVARVDEAAVRNTQDVDILIRREDLDEVKSALEGAGFVYRHSAGLDMFLDGPTAKARDAVHVVMAGEKVRDEYVCPAPEVTETDHAGDFSVLELEALVRMELIKFGRVERVNLRDLIDVGLLDRSWPAKFPPELAARLQELLDTPDG